MHATIKALTLLLGALTLASASARDIDPDEWVPCAREGQTCHVPGLAQVRFGANGRFAIRNIEGRVECDASGFGDVPTRAPKLCEYRMGWNPALPRPVRGDRDRGWQDCAPEGEVCRFRGQRLVRFGAEGAYHYRQGSGAIECSVNEFGDPVYGVRKTCQVHAGARGEPGPGVEPGRAPGPGPEPGQSGGDRAGEVPGGTDDARRNANRWSFCAREGETCSPSAPTLVRYGASGQYHYRHAAGTLRCSANDFGDPMPGVQKTCDVNTVPVDRTVARQPDPDEVPPLDDRYWVTCASETLACRFRGDAHVRFGANGLFRVVHARDGLICEARSFGGDPTPKVRKTCAVYRP